jgi:hypothetical protein
LVGVFDFVIFEHDDGLQKLLKYVVKFCFLSKYVVNLLKYSFLRTGVDRKEAHKDSE